MSLIFALLALAVLSLAAVALVRSVDTGTLVLGNLGFKQDATKSSDQGAEQAITWLSGNAGAALYNDSNASTGSSSTAYWASSHDKLDPTGSHSTDTARAVIDWDLNGCSSYASGTFAGGCLRPVEGTDVNGNKTRYAIFRLCPTTGAPNTGGNDCARPIAGQQLDVSVNRGELNYRKYERFTVANSGVDTTAYYRIIVRTVGGKNATSYTETIVHK